MRRIFLSLILVFVNGIAFSATAAAPAEKKTVQAAAEAWKNKTFTLDELKKFNGKNGMPAYVAIEGIVYDVSNVKPWSGGYHMRMHNAGEDLTAAFLNKAPKSIHGNVRNKLPKVGVLVPGVSSASAPAQPPVAVTVKASTEPAPAVPIFEYIKIPAKKIGTSAVCPVMKEKFKIKEDTPAIKYKNETYYFCCPSCPPQFRADPEKYIIKKPAGKKTGAKK